MATATVRIHGGDYDCSELVRMCYAAVGVLPSDSWMWTGNEISLLTSYGFVQRSLSSPQAGDVLWRDGHTEIVLMDGRQGGARHGDAPGGLTGRKGDQSGTEVTASAYRASDWSKLLRYEGGKTIGGIPCAIGAALVAQHVIDHEAHGYSQPNRAGDGTTENITITWEQPVTIPCAYRVTATVEYNIRTRMSMESSAIVGQLRPGQRVKCDGIVLDGGKTWLHYKYKGKDRYLKYTDALVVA